MLSSFFLLTSEAVYVEESGSPYDPGSLTGTEETILLTPQQHGIPMQTSGRKQNQIVSTILQSSKSITDCSSCTILQLANEAVGR